MKPPPRVWWDGQDFWVLAPPPYADAHGRTTLPSRFRLESVDDLEDPDSMVELVPGVRRPERSPLHGISAVSGVIAVVLAVVVLAVIYL